MKIKAWNQEHFKNIFAEKRRAMEELEKINEVFICNGMSNEDFLKEKMLKDELNEILKREEIHWRQKSRDTVQGRRQKYQVLP